MSVLISSEQSTDACCQLMAVTFQVAVGGGRLYISGSCWRRPRVEDLTSLLALRPFEAIRLSFSLARDMSTNVVVSCQV